ncbi:MAG TPA: hypothetical protein VM120_12665 [Bryobacteraceae bacterium]|nr:hypothetical protein [Bryobacteraceae bacterium]
MKRFLYLLAVPVFAGAQVASVDVGAPTLGYLFDEQSKTLHAMEGIPGAASVGEAINLGASIDFIQISPGRRYGLATTADYESLLIVSLDGSSGVARQSDLPAARAFFSPSGETAALLTAERVEIWTGMPDHPVRSRSFPRGGWQIRNLAVSDDGACVVGLDAGTLWRLSENETAVEIGQGVRDAAFLRLTHDLLVLEETRLVRFPKAGAESREEITGVFSNARAMSLSSDERSVAVLDDNNMVLLVNRESNAVTRLELEGAPAEGLWRAQGTAVFQLSRGTASEPWLLDGDSGMPRLVAAGKRGNQ